jgi:hypothetical protein
LDSKSVLKKLTKDVTIGSTVDPTNGDTNPHAISVVPTSYGKLKKNQILVCNYANASGNPGTGTTIEEFNPAASSTPTRYVQSTKIAGCDGDALTSANQTYATGEGSKLMAWITQKAAVKKTYGNPITEPIADADAPALALYSPEYIFIGNGDTGAVDNIGLGSYGNGKPLEVIAGFDVGTGSNGQLLGPSGLAYWCGVHPGALKCKGKVLNRDTLYVADGACNTIVAISNASSLLVTDEITVQPGCQSFSCKYPSTTCGTVVKTGSPLSAPVAETLLPNGNLVVANSGDNNLVELTPSGKVLATKAIDSGESPGVSAVFAIGSTDKNTAIYYTDTNTNTLHELER